MAVSRELSIRYGDLTMGGDSDYPLDGYHEVTHDHESVDISWSFFVTSDSEDGFVSKCKDVETRLRRPYQDLEITLGRSLLFRRRQSDNTGLDSQPEVSKGGDPADTGRSRLYRVRVRMGLPADNVDTLGHRRSSISVAYSPSRRKTVTIEGMFTAVTSNDARAQYEAKIATFCTSALTAIGGTFELIGEPVTRTSTNGKTIDFLRVYEERIYGQGSSTLDDSALVGSVLEVSRTSRNTGHSPDAQDLTEVIGQFSCSVDKTVSQDLAAKWASVKPWIIEKMQAQTGSRFALVSARPVFDYDRNTIACTLVGLGTDLDATSQDQIAHRIEVADSRPSGKVFVPAWTGNPEDCYIYDGPVVTLRTITQTTKILGHVSIDQVNDIGRGYARLEAPGDSWVRVEERPARVHLVEGLPGSTLQSTEITMTSIYRRARQIGPTTVSSGGDTATTGAFA